MATKMPSAAESAETTEKYSIAIGQLVGNYRIERLIDEGGMGAVFYAVHKEIGRRAAVKVLMRDFAADAEFSARFYNEARAVNLISHPGVVEIFEFGHLADGTPYIIMEFLDGESVGRRIRTDDRREFRQSLEWSRQIALALTAAHKNGIIHRDLKPENIFVIADPVRSGGERLKILDFGIAKLGDVSGKAMVVTAAGSTMGSPLYMAPEQCYEMGAVTERADVYALGIILYELLTGRTPFLSELAAELMVMHVKRTPPPLRSLNPAIPNSVVLLVDSMLHKDPSRRPSMDEVAQRLESLLAGPGLKGAWQPGAAPPVERLPLKLMITAALLLLALIGIGLFVAVHEPTTTKVSAPKTAPVPPRRPAIEPESTANPPAGTTSPKSVTIRHELSSEPSGAKVIDVETGEELGLTPITLNLPRSNRPLRLTLHHSGYQDRSLLLDRTRDGKSSERLLASPSRKKNATPPASDPAPTHEELLAPKL